MAPYVRQCYCGLDNVNVDLSVKVDLREEGRQARTYTKPGCVEATCQIH